MSDVTPCPPEVEVFIERWSPSGGAELSNSQLFLTELCDLLGLPHPEPFVPDVNENSYVFERPVVFDNLDGTTSSGRVDLYRRGRFVLESKQGSVRRDLEAQAAMFAAPSKRRHGTAIRDTPGWDQAMRRAKAQAERYVKNLPVEEGRPPFVIVVDVGHSIELYAEFSCTGGTYVPFPDPQSHRGTLAALREESFRETLRQVWTAPAELDPARRSARITRDIADRLARLAKRLEADGHEAHTVATFLMRCLFTMFAEDIALLPTRGFTDLLESLRDAPETFKPMAEELWGAMKKGGFSAALRQPVLWFNGVLFEDATAIDLDSDQLGLLIEACRADWREVEPAIFGTLLERALEPRERHKLGAHYTPRAYVERLVIPTVVEPLRLAWDGVLAAAQHYADDGDRDAAMAELQAFHAKLCSTRVLDPACGTGNFLYVTLEHLKRLEGELLDVALALGGGQLGLAHAEGTVGPHQFLGLEINPRAAAIAELVLWIGYLQWHRRTHGNARPPEPVIEPGHNIECRDAVLAYDAVVTRQDAAGQVVTRWDGVTMKLHPATGKKVPDETATVEVVDYVNPRPAEWPEADYVVGNPPFIGNWRMRQALGDGYAEALRGAVPSVPESCEYVMYWWHHAAKLAREGKIRRFGLITTNSLSQVNGQRMIQPHLSATLPLSLLYAIADHPWVDAADGADVRIAMTVGAGGAQAGRLQVVDEEHTTADGTRGVRLRDQVGTLHADLTVGVDITAAEPLRANGGMSCPGVKLHGSGFIVTPAQAAGLGLGKAPGLDKHIRLYRNGRDITGRPRDVMAIDLFGLSAGEVRQRWPQVYQWVVERVKSERDLNNRATYRENWWVFGEPRAEFRPALQGLPRYIATSETAKHRCFVFLDASILPDNKLVCVALDDSYALGVLSSRLHVAWALASGGNLGVGNDPVYVKTRCFDPYPFPDPPEELKQRIRGLGEQLDAHRKQQQAEHDDLTLTDMYNVLEKLRAGEALTARERTTHERGLVSVLQQLHDELDAAVCEAYGWPADLADEELLERLVALNRERAAEEKRGLVRWLRPEYQNPGGTGATQLEVAIDDEVTPAAKVEPRDWPERMSEQAQAVAAALGGQAVPADVEAVARCFKGRLTATRRVRVTELLETLAGLGQVRAVDGGRYVAG